MSDSPKTENEFTFITGIIRSKDTLCCALNHDLALPGGEDFLYFLYWHEGNWLTGGGRPWPIVGMTMCFHPIRQAAFLGPLGQMLFTGAGQEYDEQIEVDGVRPDMIGDLRAITEIEGQVYVAGMDRQVYRRLDRDRWANLRTPTLQPAPGTVTGFEAIAGFDASEIYAGGWDGEVWRYDGQDWAQIDSPTNLIITDMVCAEDGFVYACGRSGLLLRGRNDAWELLMDPDFRLDLWSVTSFKGSVYVSGYSGVYRLDSEGLKPVDFGDDQPGSFYHLASCPEAMISIGGKDVFRFDGERWDRLA